jgi:uncharacterized protein (DUF924 family)
MSISLRASLSQHARLAAASEAMPADDDKSASKATQMAARKTASSLSRALILSAMLLLAWTGEMQAADSDLAGRRVDTRPQAGVEPVPAEAYAVVTFWRKAGYARWFAKDAEFDQHFRERFLPLHEAAVRGELSHWMASAEGSLGLLILLDQFPRNAFRATPRMYATDDMARRIADAAIAAGHDRAVDSAMQLFFYLPFGHSERMADQDRSVALARRLGQPSLGFAEHHREIVRRFGRFPHRNAILGRRTTAEEQRFLDEGGFAG